MKSKKSEETRIRINIDNSLSTIFINWTMRLFNINSLSFIICSRKGILKAKCYGDEKNIIASLNITAEQFLKTIEKPANQPTNSWPYFKNE